MSFKKNVKKVFVLLICGVLFMPAALAAYDNYTITVEATNGTVTSGTTMTVADGDTTYFTVVPNSGYAIGDNSILCDGINNDNVSYVASTNTLNISNVTADVDTITCYVVFEQSSTPVDPGDDDTDPVDPDDNKDDEEPENPDTAAEPIYVISVLGIVCFGYGIYLLKKKNA